MLLKLLETTPLQDQVLVREQMTDVGVNAILNSGALTEEQIFTVAILIRLTQNGSLHTGADFSRLLPEGDMQPARELYRMWAQKKGIQENIRTQVEARLFRITTKEA